MAGAEATYVQDSWGNRDMSRRLDPETKAGGTEMELKST